MKLFSFPFKKNSNLSHNFSSESNHAKEWLLLDKANKLYYEEKRDEEALSLYDKVIISGISEAYIHRAFCLQNLKYHFEAIEDFNRGIQLEPENANHYFGRSNSKSGIGDFEGQISDLRKAIELSRIKSETNRINDLGAKAQRFESSTELYESNLNFAMTKSELMNKSELLKKTYIEKLDIKRRN